MSAVEWGMLLATVALVSGSLLPLLRLEHWIVRGLDFPRMQLACALALLLVAQGLTLDFGAAHHWALGVLTLGCLALQVWWIVPYTRLFRCEVLLAAQADTANTVRVMTANVLTPNREAPALRALVEHHQPDLLITLETDAWWQAQLEPLHQAYPHRISCPQDNLYGMHLYSRYPLSDTEVQCLVEDGIPSIHTLVTLPSGRKVRLHCLHPAPPSPTENETSSERDAELVMVGKRVRGSELAVIVTGDLNDVAWSATTRLFRKLSGLLDPRVGRGMFNTYHADHWFLRWPLDHLFHSDHFRLLDIRRLPSFGSDHFPMLVTLLHTGDISNRQDGLSADADDRAQARDKVEDEGVQVADVHLPGGAGAVAQSV